MTSRARITSWMAPDAVGGPWYPIDAIRAETHAHVLLELALEDAQVLGCLAIETLTRAETRRGVRVAEPVRRIVWQEWRGNVRALAPLCPYRRPAPGIQWTWREPRAFRPLDDDQVATAIGAAKAPLRAWPATAALPLPLESRIRQVPPPPAPEGEPDPLAVSPEAVHFDPARRRPAYGWPYPEVALGDRIPPATIEEAEARLLRAWRTAESGQRVGGYASGTCADIPRELVMIWRRYADRDRLIDARLRGLPDDPSLDARPARWEPERRDLNDCAFALDWLRLLAHPKAVEIVEMRAALPPYSWRQVAERVRLTPAGARAAWRTALQRIVTATGGDGAGRDGRGAR